MRKMVVLVIAALALSAGVHGAQAQQPLSIRIVNPANGSSMANPARVRVEIGGGQVGDASAGNPQALHYHILIDVDPATVILPGQPLPTGRSEVVHTANQDFQLADLAPGRHTVSVVLTRADHVPLNPNIQDQVTFTIGAAQATPAAGGTPSPAGSPPAGMPTTGTGAVGDSGAPVSVLIGLSVFPLAVAGAAVFRRRHRR